MQTETAILITVFIIVFFIALYAVWLDNQK